MVAHQVVKAMEEAASDSEEPTQRVASSNQPARTISTRPFNRERKMGPF